MLASAKDAEAAAAIARDAGFAISSEAASLAMERMQAQLSEDKTIVIQAGGHDSANDRFIQADIMIATHGKAASLPEV